MGAQKDTLRGIIMRNILVTGAAGFIGFHTSIMLLGRGDYVVGIDNMNDYYSPELKKARLEILEKEKGFRFIQEDICSIDSIKSLAKEQFDAVIHIAAQAGVRHSIENPTLYEKSNVLGTLKVLEFAKARGIREVVFASSSSVYGGISEYPFSEDMRTDCPVSLYAATKLAGELMCSTYHRLYGIRFRILRFFTVYGPWGRPDMALFRFVSNIICNKPIDVYNNGEMERDFTYIDDVVSGVVSALDSELGFGIFNIGRGKPEKLMDFIRMIEKALGKKARLNMMPMQKGDVPKTFADISKAHRMLGYAPKTAIEQGVAGFVEWHKGYHSSKH